MTATVSNYEQRTKRQRDGEVNTRGLFELYESTYPVRPPEIAFVCHKHVGKRVRLPRQRSDHPRLDDGSSDEANPQCALDEILSCRLSIIVGIDASNHGSCPSVLKGERRRFGCSVDEHLPRVTSNLESFLGLPVSQAKRNHFERGLSLHDFFEVIVGGSEGDGSDLKVNDVEVLDVSRPEKGRRRIHRGFESKPESWDHDRMELKEVEELLEEIDL